MSKLLEGYINQTVSIVTNDGRQIMGVLRGFDQTVNCILEHSKEKVYSPDEGVEDVPLGLYIIRGDNIALVGEVDVDKEEQTDWTAVKANPLPAIIH